MPDRDFVDPRARPRQGRQVVERQVVAGIEPEPELPGLPGRRHEGGEDRGLAGRAERLVIGSGVELDPVGADSPGAGDHRRLRVGEQRHPAAQRLQAFDHRADEFRVPRQVPAVIGGRLLRRVRHQRDLVRPDPLDQCQKPVVGIALDVELTAGPGRLLHQLGQIQHVLLADVPGVRARMHGDPGGAGLEHRPRRAQHARLGVRPGIPEGRHLVEIDAEGGHAGRS